MNVNAWNFQLQTWQRKCSKFSTSNLTTERLKIFNFKLYNFNITFSNFWNSQILLFLFKIDPPLRLNFNIIFCLFWFFVFKSTKDRTQYQACAEITHLFFNPYNYGIMRSRLEHNYTLRTVIAWNIFIHVTHDSKVVERISMRINVTEWNKKLSAICPPR